MWLVMDEVRKREGRAIGQHVGLVCLVVQAWRTSLGLDLGYGEGQGTNLAHMPGVWEAGEKGELQTRTSLTGLPKVWLESPYAPGQKDC